MILRFKGEGNLNKNDNMYGDLLIKIIIPEEEQRKGINIIEADVQIEMTISAIKLALGTTVEASTL